MALFTPIHKKIFESVNRLIQLHALGLDISDTSVKYLRLNPTTGALDKFGEFNLPPGTIDHGEIVSEENLVKAFQEWMAHGGKYYRRSFVVVSLPEEKSFLRIIQIPKMKKDTVAGAVRWEIEANIPLPPEELHYDFEVIESPEKELEHIDVMVSALPRSIVESYVRVLKRVGLRPVAMELESQSIMRAILPLVGGDGVKIIVDIGRNRTSFIIFAGGSMVYTTTIDFGGKVIEESIMKGLGVSKEEATSIKIRKGISKSEYEGKLFESLSPALVLLFEELAKTIKYYQSHIRHPHTIKLDVDEIVLVGGDASLLGLQTFLASNLKIPVQMVDPFGPMFAKHCTLPRMPKHLSYAYVPALGLAMRGA